MRQTGPASWCVGIDEPEAPVLGLFVRDVAGLTSSMSGFRRQPRRRLAPTTVATRLNHLALSRSASGLVGRSGLRGAAPYLLASFGLATAS